MRQILIPTPEQLTRLAEIKKAITDYQDAIATAKTARPAIKKLDLEAREIQFGPVKPRKPRTPKVVPAAGNEGEPEMDNQEAPAVTSADVKARAKARR